MSQLTLASIPGFFDLDDAVLAGDQPLTDDAIIKINENAKFAAVRPERISMGWYVNGNIVGLPVSPVDGYAYSAEECSFDVVGFCSRAPGTPFTPGQADHPPIASGGGGAGNVLYFDFDITPSTRAVSTAVSYYVEGGTETPTTDGMVKVRATCIRSSVDN